MSQLKNKIDFKVFVSVKDANQGDPLNGNRPRTSYTGVGEMSAECIKRKIRNRLQDMGQNIFVQSDDRCQDEFKSLSERASGTTKNTQVKMIMQNRLAKLGWMCEHLDKYLRSKEIKKRKVKVFPLG